MKGEKRLNEIKKILTGVLEETAPEEARNYEIRYEPITHYDHGTGSGNYPISPRDSPAYGLRLVSKDNPSKSVEILEVFWPDIKKKMAPWEPNNYRQGFKGRIKEGENEPESGRKDKPSKLELLGILSIVSIILGMIFVSGRLTGFVIADLNQTLTNWIGSSLFLVGVVGSLLMLKSRKNNSAPNK